MCASTWKRSSAILPAAKAVSAYDEGNFRKHAGQKRRLVADFLCRGGAGCPGSYDDHLSVAATAVPSSEDTGFPVPAQQDLGDARHERRLAGSSYGEIANAYHWPRQALGFKPALSIAGLAQRDAQAKCCGKRQQKRTHLTSWESGSRPRV